MIYVHFSRGQITPGICIIVLNPNECANDLPQLPFLLITYYLGIGTYQIANLTQGSGDSELLFAHFFLSFSPCQGQIRQVSDTSYQCADHRLLVPGFNKVGDEGDLRHLGEKCVQIVEIYLFDCVSNKGSVLCLQIHCQILEVYELFTILAGDFSVGLDLV